MTVPPLLQEYLAQLAARGVTHVPLNEEARNVLRGSRDISPAQPASTTPSARATMADSARAHPSAEMPAQRQSAPPVQQQADPPSPPRGDERVASKKELLAELAREAEGGKQARELGTLREVMVFAVGNPDAEVMFIGEAPGAEEEKQREPFVGPAGQLLTKIVQAMGLRRSEVYISNVCKFRPLIEDGRPQGSRNRAPTVGEMLSCQSYILAEIDIIKPKVIVCLGATASTGLGLEGTVGKLRGKVSEWRGTPLVVTYHPSYLLRRETEDGGGLVEKRLVWEDMMRVMQVVGLPISEKQKAYFTKATGR